MTSQEIISVHVGQTGIELGKHCWDLYCLEHKIKADGSLDKSEKKDDNTLETFFDRSAKGIYVPRAIFADLDPSEIDIIKSEKTKTFLHAFPGKEDSASTYARGYHMITEDVLDSAVSRIRHMSDILDYLEGFMFYHSAGGGTGSGFTAHMMERLKSDYGKKTKLSFSIYPGDTTSASVVEPYNAVFFTHAVKDFLDVSIMFSNDPLVEICQKNLDIGYPEHRDVNQLIGQVVSSVTGTMRFDGAMNKVFREYPENLTYGSLKFVVPSFSPIDPSQKNPKTRSTNNIASNCLESNNQMMPWDNHNGEYLSCSFLFRGKTNETGTNKAITNIKKSKKVKMLNGTGDIKVSMIQQPCSVIEKGILQQQPSTACMLSNSTAMVDIWTNLKNKFQDMYQKKAYVHWYVTEGMEEIEFSEACESITSLCEDYRNVSK